MQAAGPSRDKDWWAQKNNPSFPSAPIADYSATSASASTPAAPKQNPFLKGGSQEDTRVRDAPVTGDGKQRQTGDKKDPRKEFEAGLKGAVSSGSGLYGTAHVHVVSSDVSQHTRCLQRESFVAIQLQASAADTDIWQTSAAIVKSVV